MPRLGLDRVPKYRKHRASGQAVVTVDGHDIYLGPHSSVASRVEYDRVIAEWLANGRRAPVKNGNELLLLQLMKAYGKHVETYYVKGGRPTSEQQAIAAAMRCVRSLYGRTAVSDFGPLALKAVREQMIESGLARGTINANVHRIRRMFRWGVENELVPAAVYQALLSVGGLRKGKSAARETAPVMPVDDAVVEATLPHLPLMIADMVRFQRLTGCRPQEVCRMRPCDIDRGGEVWTYRPSAHKTEHHGKGRTVFIGPRAQIVLRPYLLRASESFCFSPVDSERNRLAERHANRKTPISFGNCPGSNRKRRPTRIAGTRYSSDSYRRAIARACELAFKMPDELRKPPRRESTEDRENRRQRARQWREENVWHPNQLRHSAATEIRRRFGLEPARVCLGHSQATVTEIYAERDDRVAIDVMQEIG